MQEGGSFRSGGNGKGGHRHPASQGSCRPSLAVPAMAGNRLSASDKKTFVPVRRIPIVFGPRINPQMQPRHPHPQVRGETGCSRIQQLRFKLFVHPAPDNTSESSWFESIVSGAERDDVYAVMGELLARKRTRGTGGKGSLYGDRTSLISDELTSGPVLL